eukprot:163413-Karenia_brevis.AAC.1
MKDQGVPVHVAKVVKGDVLYVPAGYFVMEYVVEGPLCYGLRKSMFLKREGLKDTYRCMTNLISKEGRDVSIMGKIAALL